MELYFHSPNTPSWSGAQLKHRDIFTFYICFTVIIHAIVILGSIGADTAVSVEFEFELNPFVSLKAQNHLTSRATVIFSK